MFRLNTDDMVSKEITDQGIFFGNRIKTLIQEGQPTSELLEQTTGPGLGSIVETFSDDSQDSSNIVAEITNLLAEYNQTYSKVDNQLTNNNMSNLRQKYGGKNVIYNSKTYYINKFGFIHQYPQDVDFTSKKFGSNYPECPAVAPKQIDKKTYDMFKNFHSYNLGEERPCVAGTSVVNDKSQAWVDMGGYKHIYKSTDDWNDKSESCQHESGINTIHFKNLNVFDNIPVGKPGVYDRSSKCEILNVDRDMTINPLITTQKKISEKIPLLRKYMNSVQNNPTIINKLNKLLNQATTATQDLHGGLNKLGRLEQDPETHIDFDLQNIKQDSRLKVDSHYLQYIGWLLISIFLIILTVYTFSASEQSLISQVIIVMVAISILYRSYSYVKYHYF